jgi:diguanylate cyclase (GGDEF)-like protein
MHPSPDTPSNPRLRSPERLAAVLDAARLKYWEEPTESLETAVHVLERARTLGDATLQARALALQAAVSVHRGDLRGAAELSADAEPLAGDDLGARTEVAALNAHLHFFSGAYTESLDQAETAVALADASGDLPLRIHARRMACVAVGNIGVDDLAERFATVLALTIEASSPWEEAICRNDVACERMAGGDLESTEAELVKAMAIAAELAPRNRFLLGVLHCTRAELRLVSGRASDAVRDAARAITHITAGSDVNPYLLAMSILMEVRALLALGRVEAARRSAEAALKRLGDRVPQARSMILSDVARAMREAGRAEEAYDILSHGAELERQALQEFSQLQLGIGRARLEMAAARRQADALALKNRQLEEANAELAEAREQLRELADRDPLTGLHNRRYLARTSAREHAEAVSFAVADIDHFKAINDVFGHQVGDRVLVRIAELLVTHLRTQDVVVRLGGEEFALLMPGAEPPEASVCCERLREVIEEEPWEAIAPGLAVTASFGVASAAAGCDFGELERTADDRLYAAKRAGRNQIAA